MHEVKVGTILKSKAAHYKVIQVEGQIAVLAPCSRSGSIIPCIPTRTQFLPNLSQHYEVLSLPEKPADPTYPEDYDETEDVSVVMSELSEWTGHTFTKEQVDELVWAFMMSDEGWDAFQKLRQMQHDWYMNNPHAGS